MSMLTLIGIVALVFAVIPASIAAWFIYNALQCAFGDWS